jgi:threonine dehydrogenase-like Zn-dependent dehydrogenase
MKRGFRVQGKGKVKDIGLRGLADYPEVERLNTEALITHAFPLERFAEAYEIARAGQAGAIEVLLEIG